MVGSPILYTLFPINSNVFCELRKMFDDILQGYFGTTDNLVLP